MENNNKPFKHYIVTRFNVGLKGSRFDYHPWMMHRVKVFTAITVPSIIAQTCQNFTWLVLMDIDTPKEYCDLLNSYRYKNLKLVFVKNGEMNNKEQAAAAILENIEPGDYDLITTRIDNDDAFNVKVVEKIHYWYAPRPKAWMINFPYGAFLDIRSGDFFPMQYLANHFPTVIENSATAKTIFFWPHHSIDVEAKVQIVGDIFWLQAIHTQNQFNHRTDRTSSVIMTDKPMDIENLRRFNLDPGKIMDPGFREKLDSYATNA